MDTEIQAARWMFELDNNYLARRLVISRFSAALWFAATEATIRVKMRAETTEEVIVLLLLTRIPVLKSLQGAAGWAQPQQATESQVWSGLRVEYGPLPKLNTRLFQNWDKWVQLSRRLNMTCCYLDWCALELSVLTGLWCRDENKKWSSTRSVH